MSKMSNAIVVGGPIAVGKSTLVGSLGFQPVFELDNNDELQDILISKMYEGDEVATKIFQFDLIMTRHSKYEKLANSKQIHVFDRTILEDYIFAKKIFGDQKDSFEYYEDNWNDIVNEMMEKIGKPQFYIIITCTWEEFKKRFFKRNLDFEIKNFEAKKNYFKEMLATYVENSTTILKKYDIPYFVLDTSNLSKLEVVENVKKKLKEEGIYE